MKKCSKCNGKIDDDSIFCPVCGNKIENEETTLIDSSVEGEDSGIIIDQEIEEETPAKKVVQRSLDSRVISGAGILAALLIVMSVSFSLFPNTTMVSADSVNEAKASIKTSVAIEELNMANDENRIIPNRLNRINAHVYPQNSDMSNLVWTSSNPNIKVNQRGYVYCSNPNETGTITVSTKDKKISATSNINVFSKEEAFYATMDQINANNGKVLKYLDLTTREFVARFRTAAEERKPALDVFTETNKNISSYALVQKKFVNKTTNNPMDFDIYSDKVSGDIRKIVTIEYVGNELEITDYYYKESKVYFVFSRTENYYRPVAAQLDFPGKRCFFVDDSLVLFREVVKNGDFFEKTDSTISEGVADWKTFEYQTIKDVDNEKQNYVKPQDDSSVQKTKTTEYRDVELKMLNYAYLVYNKAVETPNISSVTGYVLDNSGAPMANTLVKAFSEDMKMLVGEARTDAEGMYVVEIPMGNGNFSLYMDQNGYVPTKIYEIDSNMDASNLYQENLYMFPDNGATYNVRVNCVDALNGQSMNFDQNNKPTLIIRKGVNNKTGPIYASYGMDSYYDLLFNIQLQAGSYTGELKTNGYASNFFTISTLQDNMQINSNSNPNITDNSTRIVLSWGNSPSDLDSHIFAPKGDHVSYYSQSTASGYLDVDDTSAYGPETITLKSVGEGTYKYYVADFTNCSNRQLTSMALSSSLAKIDIYNKNGLVGRFMVPRNKEGVIWHAFNISNGRIEPVQRIFNNVEDYSWWSSRKN